MLDKNKTTVLVFGSLLYIAQQSWIVHPVVVSLWCIAHPQVKSVKRLTLPVGLQCLWSAVIHMPMWLSLARLTVQPS